MVHFDQLEVHPLVERTRVFAIYVFNVRKRNSKANCCAVTTAREEIRNCIEYGLHFVMEANITDKL